MKTFLKSCVVACAVLMLLPLDAASDEQLVPWLDMEVQPTVLVVRPPCPDIKTVTLTFENNSLETPITVDWSSEYIRRADSCVADYTPKGGTVGPIPPGGSLSIDITLSFICDCAGLTEIEFSGVVQGYPGDTDTDVLRVVCVRGVPSMTNLGLLILIVLLLGSGLYVTYRRRVRTVV